MQDNLEIQKGILNQKNTVGNLQTLINQLEFEVQDQEAETAPLRCTSSQSTSSADEAESVDQMAENANSQRVGIYAELGTRQFFNFATTTTRQFNKASRTRCKKKFEK